MREGRAPELLTQLPVHSYSGYICISVTTIPMRVTMIEITVSHKLTADTRWPCPLGSSRRISQSPRKERIQAFPFIGNARGGVFGSYVLTNRVHPCSNSRQPSPHAPLSLGRGVSEKCINHRTRNVNLYPPATWGTRRTTGSRRRQTASAPSSLPLSAAPEPQRSAFTNIPGEKGDMEKKQKKDRKRGQIYFFLLLSARRAWYLPSACSALAAWQTRLSLHG